MEGVVLIETTYKSKLSFILLQARKSFSFVQYELQVDTSVFLETRVMSDVTMGTKNVCEKLAKAIVRCSTVELAVLSVSVARVSKMVQQPGSRQQHRLLQFWYRCRIECG